MQDLRVSKTVQELLRCPVCKTRLVITNEDLTCAGPECGVHFPRVNGIPVLINEAASVFSISDFLLHRSTTLSSQRSKVKDLIRKLLPGLSSNARVKKALHQLTPSISKNINSQLHYRKLADLLLAQSPTPRVLVVGGGILGQGMESLTKNRSVEIIETDVSFGPRTMLICDAHDIPFEDESFDGVIVQAVLEHVVDPHRCVEEIHRVLKKQGFVYSETPFMQQVHIGRYDFTRFTHLGHRRLFRKFDEIDSGAVCGPGMALAWSYQYFLWSFTTSRPLRAFLSAFATLTSFYLKYFDTYLIDKPGTFDAASGFYFIGQKGSRVLSDRDLIKLYRGQM
jgi:SAM-dependent methyltransferase/uncharacterized protein YbaR (Trm112 family)